MNIKLNLTENDIIIDVTKQIVRYLFSQYLNVSDQPIEFKWQNFDNMMVDFCQTYFLKSFDDKSDNEMKTISELIKNTALLESQKIINEYDFTKLPIKKINDELDLLNSIYFDITVSLLNSFYHQEYFSKFFEYNLKDETPSISKYFDNNRYHIKEHAIQRLDYLCHNFNIEPIDKKLLIQKMDKYYSVKL